MSDYVDAVLVIGYDWQGLYLNGELVCEGYRIEADDVLFYLKGKRLDTYLTTDCDGEWLESNGVFPRDLSEVKRA